MCNLNPLHHLHCIPLRWLHLYQFVYLHCVFVGCLGELKNIMFHEIMNIFLNHLNRRTFRELKILYHNDLLLIETDNEICVDVKTC